MTESLGVLIAIVSSSLGGTAAAVTRYLVSDADAVTLAILRWGIGFLCVLPVALILRVKWPGGALAFILWVMALERASPTRVANTMTVNPIAAGLLATQLVGEPITLNLVVGLIAVFAGIWIATTQAKASSVGVAP